MALILIHPLWSSWTSNELTTISGQGSGSTGKISSFDCFVGSYAAGIRLIRFGKASRLLWSCSTYPWSLCSYGFVSEATEIFACCSPMFIALFAVSSSRHFKATSFCIYAGLVRASWLCGFSSLFGHLRCYCWSRSAWGGLIWGLWVSMIFEFLGLNSKFGSNQNLKFFALALALAAHKELTWARWRVADWPKDVTCLVFWMRFEVSGLHIESLLISFGLCLKVTVSFVWVMWSRVQIFLNHFQLPLGNLLQILCEV